MEEELKLKRIKTINYIVDHEYGPVRGHDLDAGLDLRTPIDVTIPAHGSEKVDLGIHFEIPEGWFGKLESKSGLNVMNKIFCGGGVIDSGFTGSIQCRLYNYGDEDYTFKAGEKFVQIIFLPISTPKLNLVTEFDSYERGDSGYGSTGK